MTTPTPLSILQAHSAITAAQGDFDISKVKIRKGTREQGGEETFRAFYGPKRIGYLMLGTYLPKSMAEDGFQPHERTVSNTAVDPEYQRKGVGTLMYDAAAAYCKSIGQELVPSMGMPLHSVSDEAYKLWQKRSPNHPRVLNDARRYEEQYSGKPIEKNGEQWTIEHTAGPKGFTLVNSAGDKRSWIAAKPVHDKYGKPGEPRVKTAKAEPSALISSLTAVMHFWIETLRSRDPDPDAFRVEVDSVTTSTKAYGGSEMPPYAEMLLAGKMSTKEWFRLDVALFTGPDGTTISIGDTKVPSSLERTGIYTEGLRRLIADKSALNLNMKVNIHSTNDAAWGTIVKKLGLTWDEGSDEAEDAVLKTAGLARTMTSTKTAAAREALTAFMQDLYAGTSANPFDPRERVWSNAVGIECRPFDGRIHLSAIRTLAEGQGYASSALDALTEMAEEFKVEIDCDAIPFGKKQLSAAQLKVWYKRHGFKEKGGSLIYTPKSLRETTIPAKEIEPDKSPNRANGKTAAYLRLDELRRIGQEHLNSPEFLADVEKVAPGKSYDQLTREEHDELQFVSAERVRSERAAVPRAKLEPVYDHDGNRMKCQYCSELVEGTQCGVCGDRVTTHCDDAAGGFSACADCGCATCESCRDRKTGDRCLPCFAKLERKTASQTSGVIGPVYHGTSKKFEKFHDDFQVYFTDSKELAERYAGPYGTVHVVTLTMNNPIDVDAEGNDWDSIPYTDQIEELSKGLGKRFEPQEEDYCTDADTLGRLAKAVGRDGVIIRNLSDSKGLGGPSTEYIALSASQIVRTSQYVPMDEEDEDEEPASKTAFISPREAEISVIIDRGTRSQVTIGVDLGIPNFTQFTITIPTPGLSDNEVSSYSRQAFAALLEDMTGFMLSLKYDEEQIVEVLSRAEVCFHRITGKDATDDGMGGQDPHLRMYEGHFEIPEDFVDETYKRVVTAAPVKRKTDVTATSAFKAWFGDSKVVDAKGKPLIVFHGTEANFDTFRSSSRGSLGSGIYFAEERTAVEYGDGNAKAVYLRMLNPLMYDANFDDCDAYDFETEAIPLLKQLFDEPTAEKLIGSSRIGDGMFGMEVERAVRTKGYDGLIATYEDGSKTWVVYQPTQIKSATNNSGTFDPTSSSITASAVRRTPITRDLQLVPLTCEEGADSTKRVIEVFKDQTTRSTPLPFSIKVIPSGPAQGAKRPKPADWEARLVV